MSKFSSFIRGLVIGLIVGALACLIIVNNIQQENDPLIYDEDGNLIVEENPISKTLVDFQDAIMQKELDKSELIVMEQPIDVTMSITESGFANWEIFSKTKQITFHGTGLFTVNMADLSKYDIELDKETKTVTIYIDSAELSYVNINLEETEFEETDKGLLSFGDINLTPEQQQQMEVQVKQIMTRKLDIDSYKDLANGYAEVNIWKIYYPVVNHVDKDYNTLVVVR